MIDNKKVDDLLIEWGRQRDKVISKMIDFVPDASHHKEFFEEICLMQEKWAKLQFWRAVEKMWGLEKDEI